MKIIVIGTDAFAIQLANGILDANYKICAFVSMPSSNLPLNSTDIRSYSNNNGIRYLEFADLNSPDAISTVAELSPDYIFCSWPKILKAKFLSIPNKFVIGTHPTELPFNRGCHPLHWVISQGIDKTMLSFFNMDEGIDSGKLILQIPINVENTDTINELNNKVDEAAYFGAKEIINLLSKNSNFTGTCQDSTYANYWRRKTPHDIVIDLRLTSLQISRIVRSFTMPYPCAKLIFENHVIKIINALDSISSSSKIEIDRYEPGKIVNISDKYITVKSGDGLIDLLYCDKLPEAIKSAKYIYPPTKYFSQYPQELIGKM